MSQPQTYDQWLALSDAEREDIKLNHWNAYAREGIAFAYMAAARLAMESSCDVLSIQIGTYHGGEYILRMTVSQEDYERCPPPLEQTFEGFRVDWIPPEYSDTEPHEGGSISGRWVPETSEAGYQFDIRLEGQTLEVSGRCRKTDEQLVITSSEVTGVCGDYASFSVYHPTLKTRSRHAFCLVAADRCEDTVSKSEVYIRAKG